MRGAAELPVSTSLTAALPSSFLESTLAVQLLEACDAVLAPVVGTLDDLDAYLDPRHAPEDFVRWLGTWLAAPVDERWPAERVRRHLPDLLAALLGRGTVAGLAAMLRAVTGSDPEIVDSGGVSWSPRPLGTLPGSAQPGLRVRVVVPADDPDTMEDVVRRVVAELVPAHVPVDVVTVRG